MCWEEQEGNRATHAGDINVIQFVSEKDRGYTYPLAGGIRGVRTKWTHAGLTPGPVVRIFDTCRQSHSRR